MDDRPETIGEPNSGMPRHRSGNEEAVNFGSSRYKDLIAITDGIAADHFLAQCAALAAALGAALQTALVAPSPSSSRYAPNIDAAAVERLALAGAAKASSCCVEIEQRTGRRVHLVTGEPEGIALRIAQLALQADLALLPEDKFCGNPDLRDLVAAALLDSASCPLLIVRQSATTLPARRAALAWNASEASSRAWRDGVPLLASGAHVDVAIGGVRAATRFDGVAIGPLMTEHLAAQEFACRVHEVPLHPMGEEWRSAADRLVEFESLVQPDLLIMGAGKATSSDGLSELTRAMIRDGRSLLVLSR